MLGAIETKICFGVKSKFSFIADQIQLNLQSLKRFRWHFQK
jgi:hypothetical protein